MTFQFLVLKNTGKKHIFVRVCARARVLEDRGR